MLYNSLAALYKMEISIAIQAFKKSTILTAPETSLEFFIGFY